VFSPKIVRVIKSRRMRWEVYPIYHTKYAKYRSENLKRRHYPGKLRRRWRYNSKMYHRHGV